MESKEHIANFDNIRVMHLRTTVDPLAVHQCSVTAVQVFDVIGAVVLQKLRVPTTDGCIIDDDITVRVAAQDHFFEIENNDSPGDISLEHFQHTHFSPRNAPGN